MSFFLKPGYVFLAVFLIALAGCGSSPQSYVDRGRKFFDAGKYDDAAIQFKKALQKSPGMGEAHYRLGLLELKRNENVQGFRELQVASGLMPDNRDVSVALGQVSLGLYQADPQHARQWWEQAVKSAERLVSRNPSDFDGNLLKGALALDDKKPVDAMAYFRKAVAAKPQDSNAKLGLAEALVQDGQERAGTDLARSVVDRNKAFSPAYDFLYARYRASGRLDDAENILKLKVASNPREAAYRMELARHFAAVRKQSEMTATIQPLLDRPADFPAGRMQAGDFYASIGQSDEALRQYQKGLEGSKEKTVYRKRIVRIFVAERKWPQATEQLTAILKDKPDDSESKLVQALVWLDEGKPENLDAAIAEFRAQSAKKPNDMTLHFQLGNALARKNDTGAARREWTTAAQGNSRYTLPRVALIQLDLAQGKGQEALPVAEELLAAVPNDPQARLLHATCLTEVRSFAQAGSELKTLAAQYPQVPQVRFRMGALALAEKKFKEAEEIFRRLEGEGSNDPQVLAGLAESYAGQNEPAKAMDSLQGGVKRNPGSAPLRQTLARFAMATGKFDLAIEQYQQLTAMAPGSKEMQLGLASAYMARGDSASAIAILEKAVKADPRNATTSLQLAQAMVAAGKVDEAKAQYRKLLATEPNNANALNDLAFLMAESGENLDQALSFAQRSEQIAESPDLKLSASDTIGWIYFKKKMDDNALQTFQALVRKNPGNATFRYHLGATLLQKGDREKARTELRTALASKPGSIDEPRIRELLARL